MPYSGFQPLPSMRTPPLFKVRTGPSRCIPPARRPEEQAHRRPREERGGRGESEKGRRTRRLAAPGLLAAGGRLRAAHRIAAVEALVAGAVAHGDVAAGV